MIPVLIKTSTEKAGILIGRGPRAIYTNLIQVLKNLVIKSRPTSAWRWSGRRYRAWYWWWL